jgi:membrane-bound serine protease (ClpP class)
MTRSRFHRKATTPRDRARGALGLALAVVIACAIAAATDAAAAGRVLVSDISGAIGVATVRQVSRAIDRAQSEKAEALILRLDTPGGLVTSTRDVIQQIIASPVPIIVYVAPSGARAASAGTFLTYAAHIAAMAPGTSIGAATPVSIGGPPEPRRTESAKDGAETSGQSTSERKALNDAVAMLRSLAQLRGRNAEWAEKATRQAATLTATEAQKEGVADIVAGSVNDLLVQADGRKVSVNGVERYLATRDANIEIVSPDLRTQLLSAISDPNIAFILLMVGFYGILLEFWTPGTFVPGVVGGISLVMALIALSALPVSYGALGLLVLGLALMIGEVLTPGFGILGVGGLVAFLAGAYFLFEGRGSDIDMAISLPLIAAMAMLSAGMIFGIGVLAIKARRRPVTTGAEQLIGARARVVDWSGSTGHVHLQGEVWSACSRVPIRPTGEVRVAGRDGLMLIVEE